jgi:hypothetical protein
MAKLAPELKGVEPDEKAREAKAVALFKQRKAENDAKASKITGKDTGQQAQTRMPGSVQAPVPNTNPVAQQTAALGAPSPAMQQMGVGDPQSPVPSTDNRYQGGDKEKDWRTGQIQQKATRENDGWWLHGMSVEQFRALGGELSEREKKLFNEGVYRQELEKRKETIKDEASFTQALKEAEKEAQKQVPWAAGIMGYELKLDSENPVMVAFKNLSTPIGAGVSGTTARTMAALQTVGTDTVIGLKICLGYLLPIQAHSFSEVMQAATPFGIQYAPKRGSANYNQGQIKNDVEAMAEWKDFDEKYSPKAIGETAS